MSRCLIGLGFPSSEPLSLSLDDMIADRLDDRLRSDLFGLVVSLSSSDVAVRLFNISAGSMVGKTLAINRDKIFLFCSRYLSGMKNSHDELTIE